MMTDSNSSSRSADTAPPLPTAQDAGKAPRNPDVQTRPPTVPPPLTSSTGTGFNAPDAGTTLPDDNFDATVGNPGPMTRTGTPPDAPPPDKGTIDRDAFEGEEKGPGSQADAEAISSTGPVSS